MPRHVSSQLIDFLMETYYYGHNSTLHSGHIFALTSHLDL